MVACSDVCEPPAPLQPHCCLLDTFGDQMQKCHTSGLPFSARRYEAHPSTESNLHIWWNEMAKGICVCCNTSTGREVFSVLSRTHLAWWNHTWRMMPCQANCIEQHLSFIQVCEMGRELFVLVGRLRRGGWTMGHDFSTFPLQTHIPEKKPIPKHSPFPMRGGLTEWLTELSMGRYLQLP